MRPWLGIVVVVVSCTEAPKPPPVVAPRAAPDAPPATVEVPLPPEPPEAVAAFDDEVKEEEIGSEEQLLRLLLADPLRAERALHLLGAPDAWQVSVLAGFATTRGEKSFEVPTDATLPALVLDGGAVTGPGAAWVHEEALLRGPGVKPKTLLTLPLNLQVEVTALVGDDAQLSVPVARAAIYGPTGHAPERVVSSSVVGRVKRAQLANAPVEAEVVMRSAASQPDDEAGRIQSVALWHRAWRLERSERTREGLLRAAWAARRASTVVHAALARNLAPGRALKLAFACTGDDVAQAKWLDVRTRRPRTPPAATCLTGLHPRVSCPDDPAAQQQEAAAIQAFVGQGPLAPRPWLRFVVDARAPRQAFVVATPLELADRCSDFEELTFEAASGQVRRLALPLGTAALEIYVPVTRHEAVEYAVINATTEARAISWLRSRGHYRWTVGREGELQPSLGVNALGFEVPSDVNATSFAVLPARSCSCE